MDVNKNKCVHAKPADGASSMLAAASNLAGGAPEGAPP
jgi:hypothetical protein